MPTPFLIQAQPLRACMHACTHCAASITCCCLSLCRPGPLASCASPRGAGASQSGRVSERWRRVRGEGRGWQVRFAPHTAVHCQERTQNAMPEPVGLGGVCMQASIHSNAKPAIRSRQKIDSRLQRSETGLVVCFGPLYRHRTTWNALESAGGSWPGVCAPYHAQAWRRWWGAGVWQALGLAHRQWGRAGRCQPRGRRWLAAFFTIRSHASSA